MPDPASSCGWSSHEHHAFTISHTVQDRLPLRPMATVDDGGGGPEPSILRRVGLAALIHELFRFFVPRQDASRSRNPLPEVTRTESSSYKTLMDCTRSQHPVMFLSGKKHVPKMSLSSEPESATNINIKESYSTVRQRTILSTGEQSKTWGT